jgi:hypothetical protein
MARRAAAQSSLPYTRERIWPPSAPRVGPWYGRRSAPSSIYNLVFIVYSALRTPLSATRVMVGPFRHSRHVGAVRVHSWPTRPARLGLRPSGSRRLCRMPRRQADQSVCCAHLRRAPSHPLYGPGQSFGWNRELCVLPYLMASPTQSIFLVSDNFSVDKAPDGAISSFQAGTHHFSGRHSICFLARPWARVVMGTPSRRDRMTVLRPHSPS